MQICINRELFATIHNITEWFGLEGSFKDQLVPDGQRHVLDQVAQGPNRPDFEHFQG